MSEYAHPEVLVKTQWVADHAKDANVRVVEVDVDTSSYAQGHIAGAVAWNWQTELQDPITRDVPGVPIRRGGRREPLRQAQGRPELHFCGSLGVYFAVRRSA